MRMLLIFVGATIMMSSSCKKNYTCECRNNQGVYDAGVVYGTKNKAADKCKNLSTANTNCYVK